MKEERFDIGIFGHTLNDERGKIASYYALYKYISSLAKKVCIIPPLQDKNYRGESIDFFRTHCNYLAKLKMNMYGSYNKIVNTFILGPGSLWSDQFHKWKNYMYLGFVESGHKKIAYGTSYGSSYPTCLDRNPLSLNRYKTLIHDFNHISHSGNLDCQISKKWFDVKNTRIVLDPVFFMSSQNWDNFICDIKQEIPHNNLLLYTETPESSHLKVWREVSKTLGMNKTLISTIDRYKLHHIKEHSVILDTETPLNVDLCKWLKYIRDSKLILTTSIYGVYFSIIFRKNFVYIPLNDSDLSIINNLGLRHRTITKIDANKIISLYNTRINWDEIHMKLSESIESSKEWLKKSLK